MKAGREAAFAEIRRPARSVIINPTLQDIRDWSAEVLADPPPVLAVDIETGQNQIKCIGFARSRSAAIVIPFVDLGRPDGSYWPSAHDERLAWELVQGLLAAPCPKVFQNGMYDLQWLRRLPLAPTHCTEDTMLLHHSLYPELQKGLGFLGSIYTSESSWKLMRRQRVVDQMTKRDE
jgi:hypothetical protein